jgi:hypothetical protein
VPAERATHRRFAGGRLVAALTVAVVVALGIYLVFGDERDLLGRFMLKPDQIILEQRPDLAYERLFPRYVELCTTSQWSSRAKGTGGVAGHAVMYLKGACKDENAPYPQLRRCGHAANALDDPEHGAGVSVNRWLRNVNWLAIPGHGLFYEGNLGPGQRLTQAHVDATVRGAIEAGVYDGVELHEYPTDAPTRSLEDFVGRSSIATDFALRYGRNVFCARIPVSEPVLDEIIAFLNDKNLEYATGEADYEWDVLADNCVHTLRNALAAANVWSPLSVQAVRLQRMFNLAIPANEFVNLARLGTEGELEDLRTLFEQDEARDALQDFGWLPTRHGAVLKSLPVHTPNDVFDTSFRMFTLQSPLRLGKTNDAIRLLSDQKFVDLAANLQHYRAKYEMILANQSEGVDSLASVRGDRHRRFGRLYRDYIRAQQAEVEVMIEQLGILEGAPDTGPGN